MANIELDGGNKKITVDSGDLTLDIPGDIILDADGANVTFKDGGTAILDISNSSSDAVITSSVQDKDLIIKGDDGGSAITAATFDMSDAGTLVLNHDLRIADAGYIGSASDSDAIAIASNGVVTFSQAPVFPDGSIAVADLDIDGATDIGAAIVDADLFIVDDGAGGTNRKVTASRLKTYAGGKNTPAFLAGLDGDQSISDSTATKLAFADEAYDSDGVYDASTNYRFTPGVAGKYYIFMRCITDTANYVRGFIYKNGSEVAKEYSYYSGTNPDQYAACAVIVDLDADDYVEAYAWHNGGSTKTFPDGVAAHYFGGFKLLT